MMKDRNILATFIRTLAEEDMLKNVFVRQIIKDLYLETL
jgi:hypothetical protein